MAFEHIAAVVMNVIIECVGTAVFGTKKPTKQQSIVAWVLVFLLVILLFLFTITHS